MVLGIYVAQVPIYTIWSSRVNFCLKRQTIHKVSISNILLLTEDPGEECVCEENMVFVAIFTINSKKRSTKSP